ncbi:hypothetical protein [Hyphococcus sp.]|uniref:hypothetical protein n=1 Tax=Hyphococcus sp. TaxID=2038636 RepID=UPI003CCBDF24
MRHIFLAMSAMLISTSAFAGTPAPAAVPEMDAGAGIAAVALLAGIAAIVREKMKK